MNTAKNSKNASVFLLITVIAAFVSVALRTVNFFFFFDAELGYYSNGAVLPIISNILLVVGVIFFIVFSALNFRKKALSYPSPCISSRIFSVVSALCVSALAVSDVIAISSDSDFGLIRAALSIFSAAYFLSELFKFKSETKIELGALLLIRLVVMLAVSYFDQKVQMNAPDKMLFCLACASAMVFIVSEMRVFVGSARSAVFCFSSAAAILFCSVSAIPSIIAYHTGRLPASNGIYFEYYLLLGVAVYAVLRLFRIARHPECLEDRGAETCGVADGGASTDTAEADESATDGASTDAAEADESVADGASADVAEADGDRDAEEAPTGASDAPQ